MFIKIAITEIDRPDHPSKQITQKVFQNSLKRQGWTFIKKKKTAINRSDRQNTEKYNFTIFTYRKVIRKLNQTQCHHSTTITQSNLYEVNSSGYFKCKGSFTEEFQSFF